MEASKRFGRSSAFFAPLAFNSAPSTHRLAATRKSRIFKSTYTGLRVPRLSTLDTLHFFNEHGDFSDN